MRFADLVAVSQQVGATSSRTAKRDAIATFLRAVEAPEIEAAVGFLMAEPRQSRTGVGWATLVAAEPGHATEPSLTITDVDRTLDRLVETSGPGSVGARHDLLHALFVRATPAEDDFLRRLLSGGLRQGALAGVMSDAVATAAGVPTTAVRRAVMLTGDLRTTARLALTEGRPGLDRVGLTVLQPLSPMLAGTADDVTGAMAGRDDEPVVVEWKLDGARIQVHRDGSEVRIFTRNLNDITGRLPEVERIARALPATQFVLDAEVLELRPDQRPAAFQHTMSRFGRSRDLATPDPTHPIDQTDQVEQTGHVDDRRDRAQAPGPATGERSALLPFFFDLVHLDGQDLVDAPLRERRVALDDLARTYCIPGVVTDDPAAAQRFLDEAIAAGHEGVMVKALESPYQAGRRGTAWRKVKPVRLFDLVVLAAEWGHGRRTGWLSNLHLGARDPATGGFVMVGKTFKGLTDALLQQQTEALLAREIGREGITVHVRPELVVEIAIDGVQASTRYPGGVALRFARVRRYRPDKPPADADPLDALQALLVR